ncbi:MAG: acyl-CoA dehydratase activase [Nitrospirota bacterium]
MKGYLGIDVGSVTTKLVLLDERKDVRWQLYTRTKGQPIVAIQEALKLLERDTGNGLTVLGVGATGSGRNLAGHLLGADVIKNEIIAHAVAAIDCMPEVRTILEIGGQDSKLIIIRNGVVVDFAMNTVCAAGTGSFLDHQASRLGIPIEEFGEYALSSSSPVRLAGRCTVFAESDMIHKQQSGHKVEDIIAGLCEALVRNYLNNLGRGKEILEPVVFQGGVAANKGIKKAFEEELKKEVEVVQNHLIMGAIGAAILSMENRGDNGSNFRGFSIAREILATKTFTCEDCSNSCTVVSIAGEEGAIASWGGTCGKWEGNP